jgi:hypothetical protein
LSLSLSFSLSSLVFISFYLLTVGVESYCCIITMNKTHTHTHIVGLLWTSDRPVAETCTLQHTTHNRQTSMPLAGFEPAMPVDPHLGINFCVPKTTHQDPAPLTCTFFVTLLRCSHTSFEAFQSVLVTKWNASIECNVRGRELLPYLNIHLTIYTVSHL